MRQAIRSKYIYTAEREALIDGYVILEDNHILAVGRKSDVAFELDGIDSYYDCTDHFVMPGFHDFHVHLIFGAMMEHNGVLRYAQSEEDAALLFWQRNQRKTGNHWLLGGAWDHFLWPNRTLPTKRSLDQYFKERPVLLLNKECHGAWVNSKALSLFHITKETPDPANGKYERFPDGEPTGYLHEKAMEPILKEVIKGMKDEELADFTLSFVEKANRLGITSVGDLPIFGITTEKAYRLLERQGKLSLRIHFASGMMEDLEHLKGLRKEYASSFLKFIGVKDFLDGTPMGHTGYMLKPYNDQPRFTSHSLIDPDLLFQRIEELDRQGFKVRLHACGDGAVRLGLNAFEFAAKKNGLHDMRHCIEHIEATTEQDIQRFASLEVIPSVQPEHLPKYDFYNHPFHRILGEDRMAYSWPFQSLLSTGAHLAYGTDFPVSELTPFRGLYRSVNRLTNEGEPKGGWNPRERVSLHESLRAYTIGAAYGAGRENELGTLTKGKLADIAVLESNPFDCIHDREAMFSMKVRMTLVDGRVVYNGA